MDLRSRWSRVRPTSTAAALAIGLGAFAAGYQTRLLDPEYVAWRDSIRAEGTPTAGARLPFSATAYCKGTTTASGVNVRTGIAAADPTLLPVGSVVNIATGDVKYNGVYTIMDTGPKMQGRLLDLYMWSCHEALAFGLKGVDVTVLRLGWNPQASAPGLIDRLFRGREGRRPIPAPDAPPPAGVLPEGVSGEAALPDEPTNANPGAAESGHGPAPAERTPGAPPDPHVPAFAEVPPPTPSGAADNP